MTSKNAILGGLLLVASNLAQAQIQAPDEVSIEIDQCSGERTTTSTDTELLIECTGDFTLAGAVRIVSNKRVVIYGHHLLAVEGEFSVTAPVLELRSDVLVNMTGSVDSPNAALLVNAIGGTVIASSTLKMNVASAAMNTLKGGLQTVDGASGVLAWVNAGTVGTGITPSVVDSSTPPSPAPVVAVAASGPASDGGGGGATGWLELCALATTALFAFVRPTTQA